MNNRKIILVFSFHSIKLRWIYLLTWHLFLYNLGTAIKQAKSGELPPQPSKPQQQAQQPAALAVPQVAICPATPAVNESELIVSSQQHQSSTSAMSSSSSVTTVQQGGKLHLK